MTANVGHMSIGGLRSDSLSTEAETTIEVLRLAIHKPRHYLYAMLNETSGSFKPEEFVIL